MKPSEYSRVLWKTALAGFRFCQTSYRGFSVEPSRSFPGLIFTKESGVHDQLWMAETAMLSSSPLLTWRRKTICNPVISRLSNCYRTERIVSWWGNESFCGCCDAQIKKKCIHHVPAASLIKWTSASSDLGFQNKMLLLSRSSFPVCRETINATRHSVIQTAIVKVSMTWILRHCCRGEDYLPRLPVVGPCKDPASNTPNIHSFRPHHNSNLDPDNYIRP